MVLLLGACSTETAADLTDDELRGALYDTFTDGDAALDDATATCLIDYLFANTSRAELNRLSDAEVDDLTEDDILFIQEGLLGCQ